MKKTIASSRQPSAKGNSFFLEAGGCGLAAVLAAAALALLAPMASGSEIPAHPRELAYPPLTFNVPTPKRIALPSGAAAYLVEDASAPAVEVRVLLRTGTLHDPAGKEGVGNLTTLAMRAAGTKTLSAKDFNETLERLAADISVDADKDSLSASLWTLSSQWSKAFPVLMEMLREPAFEEALVEIERGKTLEALRRVEDNPRELVSREFARLLYAGHPYGTPEEGTASSVGKLSLGDLRAFHQVHFHPANMVIAMGGDIKERMFLRDLNRALDGWKPPRKEAVPPPAKVDPKAQPSGFFHVEKPLSQTSIRMGHLGLRRDDPRYFAARVMNFILGEGSFTARLTSRIRAKEGLAYFAGSRFAETRDLGFFFASTQTKSETTKRAIDLMLEEIERLRREPVSDDELRTAKESLINSLPFRFESAAQTAAVFAELDVQGLPRDYYQTYVGKISAVTKDDVLRAAHDYVRPENMVILTVGKEAGFDKPLAEWGGKVTRVTP